VPNLPEKDAGAAAFAAALQKNCCLEEWGLESAKRWMKIPNTTGQVAFNSSPLFPSTTSGVK